MSIINQLIPKVVGSEIDRGLMRRVLARNSSSEGSLYQCKPKEVSALGPTNPSD